MAKVKLGAALAACAALQAVLQVTGHPRELVAAGGVATTLIAVAAAIRYGRQAARTTGPARRAWLFAGGAVSMWAIASAGYTADVFAGVTAPPPHCSGAMYAGVPSSEPVAVIPDSELGVESGNITGRADAGKPS